MATIWQGQQEQWTEVWTSGDGRDRSYCGIAKTDEGFAVDVFDGDTCVASTVFASYADADLAAQRLRGRDVRNAPVTTSLRLDTPAAP